MIQLRIGRYFFLIVLIFWIYTPVLAQHHPKKQTSDTIVIYETKIVYDTLFVYDTLLISNPIKSIPLQSGKAETISEFIKSSNDTTSSDSIIRKNKLFFTSLYLKPKQVKYIQIGLKSDNYIPSPEEFLCKSPEYLCKSPTSFLKKDIVSFKKNEPSGLGDFWVGSRFGISVGGGGWWSRSIDYTTYSNISASPNFGIFYENSTIHNISLKVELNYSWLLKKGIKFEEDDFYGTHYSSTDLLTPVDNSEVFQWGIDGESDSEFSFSQLTLPVKVGYMYKTFQPYMGLEYMFRMKKNGKEILSAFNALAGIDICLSKRLSLGINYSIGLSEEFDRDSYVNGTIMNDTVILSDSSVIIFPDPVGTYLDDNNGPFFSQRFDVTLYFNFSKNKSIRL